MHVSSPIISRTIGNTTFHLKLDNLQPSGSFKIRGIGFLVLESMKRNPHLKYIISSSGGNAGLAAAYASRETGLEAHVFCPQSTDPRVVEKLRSFGASVEVVGKDWNEANGRAMEFMDEMKGMHGVDSCLFVHPFDHELIWKVCLAPSV